MIDIINCKFKLECMKTWESLTETKFSNLKYCEKCDRGVHLCLTKNELEAALKKDICVAVDPVLLKLVISD